MKEVQYRVESDQGIDAVKKVKACRRRLVADAVGFVPAVIATVSSGHDCADSKHLLDRVDSAH
ncbi:hypothetical protein ACF08N_36140 [Streptomyces sp. NPDC015127]|uniref:hypothetical protein n=1 Tax=Streptomyces sp. NPDC015127 TaxID=3364939 RepID=UPI0036F79FEF